MKITPAIKGQITKAVEASKMGYTTNFNACCVKQVQRVFVKYMPAEQAKHAAKRYLAAK